MFDPAMRDAYRFYIHNFQLSWELIGTFSFDTYTIPLALKPYEAIVIWKIIISLLCQNSYFEKETYKQFAL